MARKNLSTKTNPLEIMDEIVSGAKNLKCVRIRYRDQKQIVTERTVEPYEFKNGKLYAYCHTKEGIRAFTVANILSAGKTDKSYTPRFPVLIV